MKHITFTDTLPDSFQTALLIKEAYFQRGKLEEHYIKPLELLGVPSDSIIGFDLFYPKKTVPAADAKQYLSKLLPALSGLGVANLVVCDATYFKYLTGLTKPDQHIGYVHKCTIKDYKHLNIIYALNYAVFMHNPNQVERLDLALQTVADHINGSLVTLGEDKLIDPVYIPKLDLDGLQRMLDSYLLQPMIACDTETFGLRLDSGGIGTIAFAKDQHRGWAAMIRHSSEEDASRVFKMLKLFFEKYQGYVVYHNASFDIKHIIYNCFMKHPLDRVGMLHGLHTMTRKIHDTKIIVYLATNSTAGNELGLKANVHEYLGNYGVDVNDITKIPEKELLEYNLKDSVGTMYVFNKFYPMMLKDNQLDVYNEIMLPALKLIIQMELVGMPMDMEQVYKTEKYLEDIRKTHYEAIMNHPFTLAAQDIYRQVELDKWNASLKNTVHGLDKVQHLVFNPGSSTQLPYLLHDVMELPVVDYTPTKAPACGAKTLTKLKAHTDDPEKIALLQHLIDLGEVQTILSTFIPHFKDAQLKEDGNYLHGNFNLGGTISGRLSSSKPNLQNIPSGSTYGKAVKECFVPPTGWLMVGADFASLEDRINTLLTKDNNKLKVYLDGFDGHCLRAYAYFKDQMPDIQQADEGTLCYEVNGQTFTEHDSINFNGKILTGKQFYEEIQV